MTDDNIFKPYMVVRIRHAPDTLDIKFVPPERERTEFLASRKRFLSPEEAKPHAIGLSRRYGMKLTFKVQTTLEEEEDLLLGATPIYSWKATHKAPGYPKQFMAAAPTAEQARNVIRLKFQEAHGVNRVKCAMLEDDLAGRPEVFHGGAVFLAA